SGAGGVAVRIVERVIAEQRKLGVHSNATVDDELVLSEYAFGVILVYVVGISERMRSGCRIARQCAAKWCIVVFRKELMHAARIQIGNGEIGRFRELAFEGQSRLHGVGRAQI